MLQMPTLVQSSISDLRSLCLMSSVLTAIEIFPCVCAWYIESYAHDFDRDDTLMKFLTAVHTCGYTDVVLKICFDM
jgi:hypothetical protein